MFSLALVESKWNNINAFFFFTLQRESFSGFPLNYYAISTSLFSRAEKKGEFRRILLFVTLSHFPAKENVEFHYTFD